MNFFALDNSSSRYVGIWYYNIPGPTMISVANRGKPLKDTRGAITIGRVDDLVILDEKKNQVWFSNVSIPNNKNNSESVLGDDGSLVLSSHGIEAWQSFENPTEN
ncbi:Bulb-type lectin domain [Sesbania bispinosa]|nr:Bulb-type lectin domain [Sesbania bispinosa]